VFSRWFPLVLAALAAVLAAAALAPAAAGKAKRPVRMNDIQVIGTHNSYHREITEPEQDAYDDLIDTPGDYDQFLAYSHARLPDQFARQRARGIELDLFPDPQGGLYAHPLVRTDLDLGPLADPAWTQPGIKVLHIVDFDYKTTCVALTECLRQVKAWSDANPRHVPLAILLELKGADRRALELGGTAVPAWDGPALDGLDAEIRSVFGPDDLITPDAVRRHGLTLEQTVRRHGWPALRESRGKVVFLLDNDLGPISDAYLAGRPNLEGRVLFTNSAPGRADAAFLKRNDPLGANTAQIQALVRQGYLVRTRSDVPLETVLADDRTMLDAALASGAQVISTDFPEVGMSARYDSSFVAALPRGGPARCNPVRAPRGCRDRKLE